MDRRLWSLDGFFFFFCSCSKIGLSLSINTHSDYVAKRYIFHSNIMYTAIYIILDVSDVHDFTERGSDSCPYFTYIFNLKEKKKTLPARREPAVFFFFSFRGVPKYLTEIQYYYIII